MENTVALVTGANKSIGFEAVRALAALGMTVYLGSRDPAAGEAAAAELAEAGDVRPIRIDMGDESSMVAAIEAIGATHGRLDVLVNNAGIAPGGGGAADCPADQIELALQTNLLGPARLIQLAVPLLKQSAHPRVVNVTSNAGSLHSLTDPKGALAAAPFKPYAYCLSKAAMNAATILFADDLKRFGIKVNAVCPGLVKSQVSRFMGKRGPAAGATVIVQYATIDDDGPTGGFFDENGPKAW